MKSGMVRLGRVMLRAARVLAVEQAPHGAVRVHFDTGKQLDLPEDYFEGECPFSVWQKPTSSSQRKTATTLSPARKCTVGTSKSGSAILRVKESARK